MLGSPQPVTCRLCRQDRATRPNLTTKPRFSPKQEMASLRLTAMTNMHAVRSMKRRRPCLSGCSQRLGRLHEEHPSSRALGALSAGLLLNAGPAKGRRHDQGRLHRPLLRRVRRQRRCLAENAELRQEQRQRAGRRAGQEVRNRHLRRQDPAGRGADPAQGSHRPEPSDHHRRHRLQRRRGDGGRCRPLQPAQSRSPGAVPERLGAIDAADRGELQLLALPLRLQRDAAGGHPDQEPAEGHQDRLPDEPGLPVRAGSRAAIPRSSWRSSVRT